MKKREPLDELTGVQDADLGDVNGFLLLGTILFWGAVFVLGICWLTGVL